MRRETNNDRQQRLFVTGLLISAVVGDADRAALAVVVPGQFCLRNHHSRCFVLCAHPCYGRHPAAGGGGRCHEDLLPDL
mgnify:CR=1 FL=1